MLVHKNVHGMGHTGPKRSRQRICHLLYDLLLKGLNRLWGIFDRLKQCFLIMTIKTEHN
uniref:Uncharacterized protein n=1 Tax=Anguilla anguilla TaxID=7936 RepID=A0A0E9S155_ANGAN